MSKINKHQDYIYLHESYYNNPKETFEFLKKIIEKDFSNPSLLDIGCARGEFLYYIKENMSTSRLLGIDYSKHLIEKAKEFDGLTGVEFFVDSAESFKISEKFDVITLSGVLSYFDSVGPSFERIKDALSENGKAYIFGFFNDYDVDVQIKYRNNKEFDTFENGWNLHALHTIKKHLSELNMSILKIHTFKLSFTLEPQDDPCRAWHIETNNGVKFTNGLGLVYDMRVLEIAQNDKNNS